MRAETVVIEHLQAAGHPEAAGSCFWGPNPIAPMVMIGVATAGPAQHRHRQRAQGGDYIIAKAAGLRNVQTVTANPETVIAAASQMLGEVSIDAGRDRTDRSAGLDDNCRLRHSAPVRRDFARVDSTRHTRDRGWRRQRVTLDAATSQTARRQRLRYVRSGGASSPMYRPAGTVLIVVYDGQWIETTPLSSGSSASPLT